MKEPINRSRPDCRQPGRSLNRLVVLASALVLPLIVTGCHVILAGEPYSPDAEYTYYGELAFINAVLRGDQEAMELGLHPDSPRDGMTIAQAQQDFPANLQYRPRDENRVEGYIGAENFGDEDQIVETYIFDVRTVTEGKQRQFEVLRVYDWQKQ